MPVELESLNTMFQAAFLKMADGEYALRTQTGSGGASTVVAVSQAGTNNVVQTLIPTAARTSAITATGKVTAPAAGAAIATTASLAIGTWDVEVTTFIGGTTVASLEMDNCRLNIAAAAHATIINPVAGTTGATTLAKFNTRVQLASASTLSVVAIAAATAGSIYSASIVATRVM